jgi:hypothetical protein
MILYKYTNKQDPSNYIIFFDENYQELPPQEWYDREIIDTTTDNVFDKIDIFKEEEKAFSVYSYVKFRRILYVLYDYYMSHPEIQNSELGEIYLYKFYQYKIAFNRDQVFEYFKNRNEIPLYVEYMDNLNTYGKRCREKLKSNAETVLRTFLEPNSLGLFYLIAQPLIIPYIYDGVEGKNYRDSITGIMDFIESTNDFGLNGQYYGKGLLELPLQFKNNFITSNQQLSQLLKKIIYFGEPTNKYN